MKVNKQKRPGLEKFGNAQQRWGQLHQKRQGMLRRFEKYASVTIPKVCLPEGVNQLDSSIQHDWTSVGAMAVNHLTNKLILTLFRPGIPFFRLDPNRKLREWLAAQGIKESQLRDSLVAGEREALQVMDQRAIRPKLNEVARNLIVVGNVGFDLTDEENPRVVGIKHYVVKRSISGKLVEIMHRERVLWNELEDRVKPYAPNPGRWDSEQAFVEYFRWWRFDGKVWHLTQHVENTQLPAEFDHKYTPEKLPFHVLTWDLADEHDYGTGLVEDYAGDFGTLSTLSEGEIKAAILASDYRWALDPASGTDPEYFKETVTGDVIPARKDDLNLVTLVSANGLELIGTSADKVIRRIGAAFLLNSAVTRDAERVTAEEIRLQAQELETSLGGVYSRLAVDLQLPVALWLLAAVEVDLKGANLTPTIVTGLAALSRNAEADSLKLWLADLAQMAAFPPEMLARLNVDEIASALAAAYSVTPGKFVKPAEQVQAEQAAAQEQAIQADAQVQANKAGAESLANQSKEAQ